MMFIPCPWCGPRDENEFHYGGQAQVHYPADPSEVSDEDWGRFLFFRSNPKGFFIERWSHTSGCRRWFTVARDTVTNTIRPVDSTAEPRTVQA